MNPRRRGPPVSYTLGAHRHARDGGGEIADRDERLQDPHLRVVWPRRPPGDRMAHHHVVEDVDVVAGPSRYDTLGNSTDSFMVGEF